MEGTQKTFGLEVRKRDADGGRVLITVPALDRDKDRVMPEGIRIDNYMVNPVVQFGHRYADPWATIGRTTKLDVTPAGIVAEFKLRPAVNAQDPQNVVRELWAGSWINTASIGFQPIRSEQNEWGGQDVLESELLEWSLVPVPAQAGAVALAAKAWRKNGQKAEIDRGLALASRALALAKTEQEIAAVMGDFLALLKVALRQRGYRV